MRTVEPFSAVHLRCLAGPCGVCLRWQGTRPEDPLVAKEAWVESIARAYGQVGWVVVDDDVVCGHILYAPAAELPQTLALPTGPASEGAAVVAGLAFEDDGVGRLLVQRAARDLRRRRIGSLEAFGGPAGSWRCAGQSEPCQSLCRVPARVLEGLGFVVERPHPSVPRYRMDLSRTVTVPDGVRDLVRSLRPRALETDPILGRDG